MILATLWESARTEQLPSSLEPPKGTQGSFQALHSPCGRLSVNAARTVELTVFPGIGRVVAQRIVAYRERHGEFQTLDGMTNVPGIGAKKVDQLRAWLCAGCTRPARCAPLGKIEPPGGTKQDAELHGV